MFRLHCRSCWLYPSSAEVETHSVLVSTKCATLISFSDKYFRITCTSLKFISNDNQTVWDLTKLSEADYCFHWNDANLCQRIFTKSWYDCGLRTLKMHWRQSWNKTCHFLNFFDIVRLWGPFKNLFFWSEIDSILSSVIFFGMRWPLHSPPLQF